MGTPKRRLAVLSSHLLPTGPAPCSSSSGVSASFCAQQRLSHSQESGHENDCVFCKIIRGESPAVKLYEYDTCLCILDTNPLSLGRFRLRLVVVAIISLSSIVVSTKELPFQNEVVAAMCAKVPLISNAIMKATDADSFNLLVNNGAAAGQVIFHTHIHIIPRKAHDCLWTSESLRRRPLKIDQETSQLADQVREKLSNICECSSKGQESSLS
ncbi:hypothetical protein CISIN_1g028160mg [Citrus sinensis]|uniref:HIT domain-containing protein n=1 Tax=Citrus sinensis TaxID=2711 RepID=A0A067FCG5_CITSI|nr:hypothetical protein CISIN_1g028160mg [Citrus sinensis]